MPVLLYWLAGMCP